MSTAAALGRVRPAVVLLVVVALVAVVAVHDLPETLIGSSSEDGRRLLIDCLDQGQHAFLALFEHWDSQTSGTFCGPASVVAVLNALRTPAPADTAFPKEMRYWTQTNLFLDPNVTAVISKDVVLREGMTLEQLQAMMMAASDPYLDAVAHYGPNITEDEFRAEVVRSTSSRDVYVIVNFDRKVIGEIGAGHHSPIGAYHAESDRVLLLDVAKQRYPPVWVELTDLYDAMLGRGSAGETRGFLTVEPADCELPPN